MEYFYYGQTLKLSLDQPVNEYIYDFEYDDARVDLDIIQKINPEIRHKIDQLSFCKQFRRYLNTSANIVSSIVDGDSEFVFGKDLDGYSYENIFPNEVTENDSFIVYIIIQTDQKFTDEELKELTNILKLLSNYFKTNDEFELIELTKDQLMSMRSHYIDDSNE